MLPRLRKDRNKPRVHPWGRRINIKRSKVRSRNYFTGFQRMVRHVHDGSTWYTLGKPLHGASHRGAAFCCCREYERSARTDASRPSKRRSIDRIARSIPYQMEWPTCPLPFATPSDHRQPKNPTTNPKGPTAVYNYYFWEH